MKKKRLFYVLLALLILSTLFSCKNFNKRSYFNRGLLLFHSNKIKDSIPNFKKASELEQDDGTVLLYLGWSYFLTEQTQNSLLAFEKAVEFINEIDFEDIKRAITHLVITSQYNKKMKNISKDILKMFTKQVTTNHSTFDTSAKLFLATSNFINDNNDETLALFKNIFVNNNDVDYRLLNQTITKMMEHVHSNPSKESSFKQVLSVINSNKLNFFKDNYLNDEKYQTITNKIKKIQIDLQRKITAEELEEYIAYVYSLATSKELMYWLYDTEDFKNTLNTLMKKALELNNNKISSKMANFLYSLDKYTELINFVASFLTNFVKENNVNNVTIEELQLLSYFRMTRVKDHIKSNQDLINRVKELLNVLAETKPQNLFLLSTVSNTLELYDLTVHLYTKIIKNYPEKPFGYNNLSWLYSTAEDPQFNDKEKALLFALKAYELSQGEKAYILDTLAKAYFINGKYAKAIETEQKAIELLLPTDDKTHYEECLNEYKLKSEFESDKNMLK